MTTPAPSSDGIHERLTGMIGELGRRQDEHERRYEVFQNDVSDKLDQLIADRIKMRTVVTLMVLFGASVLTGLFAGGNWIVTHAVRDTLVKMHPPPTLENLR